MTSALGFSNYSFTYTNGEYPALRNIDLTIQKGDITLIAGPSGCGKSTLLRSINGLIPHMYSGVTEGTITVGGNEVSKTPISELATKVGYVFQNPENQIFMFSVERDIAFGLENLGIERQVMREKVDWVMDVLRISDLAQRAPHTLSDGQKQRVALAGILAMEPDILILDEPTSLLDPHTASELVSLIKHLNELTGITVLIVEHRLDLLADISSRIVILHEGCLLLDGDPRNVLRNPKALDIGVGIPTMTRLHNILVNSGYNLGDTTMSVEELLGQLKEASNDTL